MKRNSLFLLLTLFVCSAEARLCNAFKEKCWLMSGHSSEPAYPSHNSSLRLNPSAVPTDDSYGAEAIYYGGQVDFGLVKGTGRIGAAISASNGEETFFGPRAIEYDSDYLARMRARKAYASQKLGLAGAVNLFDNKREGVGRLRFSLGVSGKYNRLTGHAFGGGGLGAILGPFTVGYAQAQDDTEEDQTLHTVVRSRTETYSAGVFLDSFAFDYSLLNQNVDGEPPARTSLFTASVFMRRWILTASRRTEDSSRTKYDFQSQILVTQQAQTDYFGGVQFSATKVLLLGVFYNYYLLREVSVGATLFL